MSIESWIRPEEVADLAAHASAMVDAALVGTALSREAFWAAVRKGYNTPYNDPARRPVVAAVEEQPALDLAGGPVAVVAQVGAPGELRAL